MPMPSSNCTMMANLSCQILRSNLKHLDKPQQKNSEPADKALAVISSADQVLSAPVLINVRQAQARIFSLWAQFKMFGWQEMYFHPATISLSCLTLCPHSRSVWRCVRLIASYTAAALLQTEHLWGAGIILLRRKQCLVVGVKPPADWHWEEF